MPDKPEEPKKRQTDPFLLAVAKLDRLFAEMPDSMHSWVLTFLNGKWGKKTEPEK